MDKSWMPTVAGVLCIITGCIALVGFMLIGFFGLVFFAVPDIDGQELPVVFIRIAFLLGAAYGLATGFVAIYGGVSALQRHRWGWCLAGAISAILICAPLGLAAIILVALSESELRDSFPALAPPDTV